MRFNVLRVNRRNLARSAAIAVVCGAAAGCSSGTVRFSDGIDGVFTGSTPNQRSIIKPEAQPFPGDGIAPSQPVNGAYGSPARAAVQPANISPAPVTRQELPPVAAAKPAAVQPIRAASRELDARPTGSVAPVAVEEEPAGWSRTGGTQITARDGETVYNLSRRFGVPANVIMKVNGLSSANALQAGQKILIPTYVYSRKAPVSAPDSDPNVADAKSSRGTRYDVPANKTPVPHRAPVERTAVLPDAPKVREVETASASSAEGAAKPETKSASPGGYVVQSGDTLAAIARKHGIGVPELKSANGLKDGLIRIGQTLVIPAAGASKVAEAKPAADPVVTGTAGPAKKADSAEIAGYTPPRKDEKVIEAAEEVAAIAPDSTGIGRMRWPVRGRVISAFGSNGAGKSNDGIDIAVPEGTPVKAAENGVVIYAGDGLKEFGNTVLVRHEDGLVTVYGHASELEVQRGDKVKRGQEIARSGMSGTTDSPKLHFEVRKNSAPVDPKTFLE
jgi:murein DD-endopeptidase MepM/ murein hydrolase activator NlpD